MSAGFSGWRLQVLRAQIAVCGNLEGLGLWIGRSDSFAQPRDEGGFVFRMKNPETEILANLGALVALGPLAPFFIEVRSWRHTGFTGEVGHYAAGNILAAIRKAPLDLERLEEDGKTEPSGTALVTQQFAFIWGKCPVLSKFIRVPVLLHGR